MQQGLREEEYDHTVAIINALGGKCMNPFREAKDLTPDISKSEIDREICKSMWMKVCNKG